MSDFRPIPIGAKLYLPRSGSQSVERAVNLYAEPSEQGGKTVVTLHGTPGLAPWSTVGSGLIRGVYAFRDDLYVVSGTTLYVVDRTSKVATTIGTVAGTGPVRMVDNGTHVVVCAVTYSYAANRTEIVQLPEQNLCSVAYQDGYVLFVQRGTQNFWISGLDDATTIDALDFTTVDAFADNVLAIVSNNREVFIFKEHSAEVFYNSGDATFPFSRNPSGFMERGIAAPGTVAKAQNLIFWLGDDLRVYRAAGYQPAPISTPAIERFIREASDPLSAEAFAYTQEGHTFFVLNFGDKTICYDVTTGLWSERESADLGRWRVGSYAYLYDTHIVGDIETSDLYELDLDTYDEDGDEIERTLQFPPLSTGARFGIMSGLFVDMETGVGLASGQGSAPVVMLDWSDDDGRTFGSEVTASLDIGGVGRYRTRVTFNRLGRFSNRTYRLKISDPVKVAILGAEARIEVSV
jgi:hypothetical protein